VQTWRAPLPEAIGGFTNEFIRTWYRRFWQT
jgi:hypothetical protein